MEISDRPQLVVPMTHDFAEIQNQMKEADSRGRTALLDGIYLALDTMKSAQNKRKALIVISDGGDYGSRYRANEITNLIREADVQIYSIGVFTNGEASGRRNCSRSRKRCALSRSQAAEGPLFPSMALT